MTIKVKKGDVEMLKAFLNKCVGEIVASKRRRNVERAGRQEPGQQVQPPSADVPPQMLLDDTPVSSNGKV